VGEGDAGFGEANEFDGLLGGDGERERLGVGQADVFAGEYDDAPRDETVDFRVLFFWFLPVIALSDAADGKVSVEVGPVEAKGRKLDVVQLCWAGQSETRIR
jgi:hypothetical protein